MVIKHKDKQYDDRVSPALVKALNELVKERSRDIALMADFGSFAHSFVYGESINEQEVHWHIVATAYLLWLSAQPVRYGIKTSVDCLRIVRNYINRNHKLNTPIR